LAVKNCDISQILGAESPLLGGHGFPQIVKISLLALTDAAVANNGSRD
jgi:hypothetical protein